MDFYKTLETVRLPGGTVLALTPGQARRRSHLLDINEADDLVARQSVEFKAGEIIGLAHVPLVLKAALEPVDLAMLQEGELLSNDLEDLDEGGLLTIDDSIGLAGAGEKIEATLEQRPDNAEPGVQIQPESGDPTRVPESKLADPTPVPESKLADPTPVPESKPDAKGKGKK
jgi:hypothetical protein